MSTFPIHARSTAVLYILSRRKVAEAYDRSAESSSGRRDSWLSTKLALAGRRKLTALCCSNRIASQPCIGDVKCVPMSEDTTGKEPSGWMRLQRPSCIHVDRANYHAVLAYSVATHRFMKRHDLRDLSNLKVVDLRWASNASSCLGWYM